MPSSLDLYRTMCKPVAHSGSSSDVALAWQNKVRTRFSCALFASLMSAGTVAQKLG